MGNKTKKNKKQKKKNKSINNKTYSFDKVYNSDEALNKLFKSWERDIHSKGDYSIFS